MQERGGDSRDATASFGSGRALSLSTPPLRERVGERGTGEGVKGGGTILQRLSLRSSDLPRVSEESGQGGAGSNDNEEDGKPDQDGDGDRDSTKRESIMSKSKRALESIISTTPSLRTALLPVPLPVGDNKLSQRSPREAKPSPRERKGGGGAAADSERRKSATVYVLESSRQQLTPCMPAQARHGRKTPSEMREPGGAEGRGQGGQEGQGGQGGQRQERATRRTQGHSRERRKDGHRSRQSRSPEHSRSRSRSHRDQSQSRSAEPGVQRTPADSLQSLPAGGHDTRAYTNASRDHEAGQGRGVTRSSSWQNMGGVVAHTHTSGALHEAALPPGYKEPTPRLTNGTVSQRCV